MIPKIYKQNAEEQFVKQLYDLKKKKVCFKSVSSEQMVSLSKRVHYSTAATIKWREQMMKELFIIIVTYFKLANRLYV